MNIADPTELALLHEVYDCKSCAIEAPKIAAEFTLAPSGSFFKFPPLIGGTGKVRLLFVGYNPRRTSNLAIHDFAMGASRTSVSCRIMSISMHNAMSVLRRQHSITRRTTSFTMESSNESSESHLIKWLP